MRYQGFFTFFGPNPSIWDPQNHQNRGFSVILTPPKIIKNRLNFAHSEICEKSDFRPNFDVKITTPFKTVKITLHSEKDHLFSYIRYPP